MNIRQICLTRGDTITWESSSASANLGNTRNESYRLSGILNSKGIKRWLDDGKWRDHD
jgi:hypothetical protein